MDTQTSSAEAPFSCEVDSLSGRWNAHELPDCARRLEAGGVIFDFLPYEHVVVRVRRPTDPGQARQIHELHQR